MAIVKRSFLSRDAAEAFIEGLEYVNESTINGIKLLDRTHGDFVVQFEDEDVEEGQ